jgi:hypothetical protein
MRLASGMLAGTLAGCLLCSVAIAADGEREEKMRGEAMQDRDQDRDRASQRQHWLYDKKNQPETTGAATGRQPCKSERVRVSRGDGTTTVTRTDKCE